MAASEAPDEWQLTGIKVTELGNFIAGLFASRLLAGFDADAIKVEPPAPAKIVIARTCGCLASSLLHAERRSLLQFVRRRFGASTAGAP